MTSKESLFYQNDNLNGQSQCYGCKQKGIWNVSWSCMMWTSRIDGHQYCDKCKEQLEKLHSGLLPILIKQTLKELLNDEK